MKYFSIGFAILLEQPRADLLPAHGHIEACRWSDFALGAIIVTDSTATATLTETPTGTVTLPVTPGVTPIPTETPLPILQWQMYGTDFKNRDRLRLQEEPNSCTIVL